MPRVAWWIAVVVSGGLAAGPAKAEFWTGQTFLQQAPEAQRSYLTGVLDMWEHVRKEVKPDPADRLIACVRTVTIDQFRARFVEWALGEPALWRLNTAELLLEGLDEVCRRP
jgi:hypothetical protein